ncbi:MarR family transcriptional regulator [Tunturiibacter empetritectus]|uniref:DNA-binding MarR family transcriptional regulator n=1 Tax=Tunturiibacter lichenicola TaxID=2051959 RepID=A0A852VQ16_9BACT|nr:MarR family transcriptional regulator [Edaphobacter lichenicola]NYF91442.1 DNA-binding MarR family transcriptional regulator [Edaphobacter lichenicola]
MSAFETETTRFIATWMQLRQVIQAANFNRFQQAGLSATQFMTLNVVPNAGMTLTELARRLNLSPATLNATVHSLEERGLVRRIRQIEDGRKINIFATKAGESLQNSTSSDFHAFLTGIFSQMSKTRREGLLAGLEQMVKLSALSPESPKPTRHADDAPQGRRSSRQSRQQ